VYARLCARACKSLSRFVIPIFFFTREEEEEEEFRCVGGFGFSFYPKQQHPGLMSHTSGALFFHMFEPVSVFLLRTRAWQLALLSRFLLP